MNNLNILGTITREPELKMSNSGTAILSFSIAYNEKYKKKDGSNEEKAMFFDVTAFGKRAEAINMYFHKGSRILIGGSLDYQSWKTQDGQNRSKVGIKLENFAFIDKLDRATPQETNTMPPQPAPSPEVRYEQPNVASNNDGYQAEQKSNQPTLDIDEDEIPF